MSRDKKRMRNRILKVGDRVKVKKTGLVGIITEYLPRENKFIVDLDGIINGWAYSSELELVEDIDIRKQTAKEIIQLLKDNYSLCEDKGAELANAIIDDTIACIERQYGVGVDYE